MTKIKKILVSLAVFLVVTLAGIYFIPAEDRALISLFTVGKWMTNIEDEQMLHESKFNKSLWLEAGSDDYWIRQNHKSNCTRGKMYYDLKDNYLKKGISQEEVFSLLGRPEYGLKYPGNRKHKYCLEYKLGGCTTWFSGPGKILLVCIKNGSVIDVFKDSANNNGESFKVK